MHSSLHLIGKSGYNKAEIKDALAKALGAKSTHHQRALLKEKKGQGR
jgi:hypothetical protein